MRSDDAGPLRLLRGRVNTFVVSGPQILQGSGFTCSRVGVGTLVVTFNTAFSSIPTATATGEEVPGVTWTIANVLNNTLATTGFRIQLLNQAFGGQDGVVNFTVMGPA